jgi:hypothetical protein
MSNAPFAYPFDPSGALASNKITAEHQTISPPELSEFLFIIPAATPFFAESMVVVHLPSLRTLVEGVDYAPTHYFHDASLQCAKPIYGSLTFYDNRLTGAVRLQYQTLGGDWVLDSAKITEILSNKLVNPRRVTWEQVADLPYAFPPIDHDWHLDDMVGMSEVVTVLEGIRDALIASGEGGLQAHIADTNNPHQTNKTHVGLGNVQNYDVATIAEAQAGTSNTKYLTVLRGAQLMQALFGNVLDAHINNSNNPHNTTKTHVGLGSVDNYATASQAEAEAGAATNRFMTPVRTAQAIAVLVTAKVDAHIARTDNPHSVTKTQVGLSNVQNYPIADTVAARAGVANDLYMTPAMTREAITAIALDGVSDHIDDTNNPHNTTKLQVGLGNVSDYAVASQAEAEDGTLNTRYMTPLRGKQQIQALIGNALTDHLNDSDNPHATTKDQVGLGNVDNYMTASNAQAVAGTATNLFLTPAGAKALILALGGGSGGDLATHVADVANPHEVTKDQVGLANVDDYATATNVQAIAGVATNLFMTPANTLALINSSLGNVFAAHAANTNNPHDVTAAQVGAYSTSQSDLQLSAKLDSTAQAADSAQLEGKSLAEVTALASSIITYPAVNHGLGDTWTLLGEMDLPANQVTDPIPDIVAEVTGGENSTFGISSSFLLRLAPRNLALSSATIMSENYSRDISYGYTSEVNGGITTVKLYARGPRNRHPIAVRQMSGVGAFFSSTLTEPETEPTGLVYMPIVYPPFARARPTFGDVAFGELPNTTNLGQTTGGLVEWVSVVHSDDDELVVQAITNDLKEEYGNYLPWSADLANYLYNDLVVLDKWGWDPVEEGIMLDTDTVNSNAMLTSTFRSTNYAFEVEISSTDPKANGAGVIAAQVEVGNRPVAITVVRTPGGLTQVSASYKLKTIMLNIGQTGGAQQELDSQNGSLEWEDTGLPDDARDPAAFVAAGHGWNVAGKVRIKVERVDNILTIDVTQFGSTGYLPAEQVVIDLAADARLVNFIDTPSAWGLISVRQPKVTFKVLNRPGMYRDYVRIGVSADNDKQRLYTFDGVVWGSSFLGINNPRVRPNRLYYSDWNGVMYQSQRNGRLRPILIEAYSRDNPTILTT